MRTRVCQTFGASSMVAGSDRSTAHSSGFCSQNRTQPIVGLAAMCRMVTGCVMEGRWDKADTVWLWALRLWAALPIRARPRATQSPGIVLDRTRASSRPKRGRRIAPAISVSCVHLPDTTGSCAARHMVKQWLTGRTNFCFKVSSAVGEPQGSNDDLQAPTRVVEGRCVVHIGTVEVRH